jgi:pimeloyl-ACP methyl ester carboxylesterase
MDIKTPSKTIVFIHGLFMTPTSWEHWLSFFEAEGYKCYAPAYEHHTGEPAQLRQNPAPSLASLTFGQVIASLSDFIDTLPEPPILIGHSMGGLAVQKLIGMGKGVAGICIDSAPPKGIISLSWSFLKANLPVINPLKGNSVFVPSLEWFQYAFCNNMTTEETQTIYNKYVVPESRNIPRSASKADGSIDFDQPHQPLLFIAGQIDHIVPAALNKKNFLAYTHQSSKTDFKEFADRTHFICGQQNWQEVASYINQWFHTL